MKSFLTILLFIFIYLIQLNLSEPKYKVDPSQNTTAIEIYKNIFFRDVSDLANFEICDFNFMYCYESSQSSEYYSIYYIYFRINGQLNTLVNLDLSSFTDLNGIYQPKSIYQFGSNFFNNLYKLHNLTSLSIYQQSTEIPSTVVLPPSINSLEFNTISVPLPVSIFESESLSRLVITHVGQGFSLPNVTKVNNVLRYLILPIDENFSKIPSSWSQYFLGIKSIKLDVFNNVNASFSFPNVDFVNLDYLSIEFFNGLEFKSFLYPSFHNMKNLKTIDIRGNGFFLDPLIGYLDFSKNHPGLYIYLYNTIDLDKQLIGSNSLRLPNETNLNIDSCNLNLNILDFSKISSFDCQNNQLQQTLPTINNPTQFGDFRISHSNIYGDVPESYCFIKNIQINNNTLNGSLPDCFRCQGGNNPNFSWRILPNYFKDFNKITPAFDCPDFEIYRDYIKLVNTNGRDIIVISGKSLGWDIVASSYGAFVISANTKIGMTTPRGIGVDKQLLLKLTNGYKFIYNYSYIPPTIKHYTAGSNNGGEYLLINGTGFNYLGLNTVSINGEEFGFTKAHDDGIILNGFGFEIGSRYEVSMIVDGQPSNTFILYYFLDLYVADKNIQLYENGGSVTINGSFGTSNKSLISVNINNDSPCNVNSVLPTSLEISYPSYLVGDYFIFVNVGGSLFNSTVQFISSTPTPTDGTTSSTPSSSDDLSSSFTLSIPFYTLFIVILLQQLLN